MIVSAPWAATVAVAGAGGGSVLTLKDVGPTKCWSRRRWLHRLRGRARAFWLPSWGREIALQQEGTPGDDVLIVASDLDPVDLIGWHVLLDLPGAPIFRQIASAAYDPLGLPLASHRSTGRCRLRHAGI